MTKKLKVHGLAIKEGKSRNNIFYSAKELAKFTPTLKGVPIQKDHSSSVDKSVGLVSNTNTPDKGKQVFYEGWITEDGTGVTDKIADKRISKVSVGAMCGRLVKESENSDVMIAKDIEGAELSLVVCPGVPGASIQQTLKQIGDKEKLVKPVFEDVTLFSDNVVSESTTETMEDELKEILEVLEVLEAKNAEQN